MEENSSGLPKLSRREALKAIAGGFLLTAGGVTLTGCSPEDTDTTSTIKNPQKVPTPKLQVATSTLNDEVDFHITEQRFFTSLENNDEKSKFTEMVGVQRKKFKEEPGFSARVKESQKWTSLVRECGQQLGYKPDSFVYDYMTSLILVESSGNSKAVSGVGARGLCQLLFSTAQDAYAQIKPKERQLLNIPKKEITPDNLFDPKTNIALCMQYLADRARFYTDPSLAFWVYHLGDGNLIHAMTAYLGNVPYTGDPKGTVERYKLNFVKLITNNAVIARLNRDGAFNDDTQFYVPRIAAAKTFLG